MSPKPWEIVSSTKDRSYRVFNLRTDLAISPRTGKEHHFFIIESTPWVNVIPLTPQNEVVLVKQYRHGTQNVTLEIPGGLVETSDSPEGAAKRELMEETGYGASEIILLGAVHPSPAIQNNVCYTYLAKNVIPSGKQDQDDKEDIQVVLSPLAEIPDMIQKGEITHSLVLSAFYRYFMEYAPAFK